MTRRRGFKDKVIIITGAGGGIGAALARRFGAAGARLGLLDIDETGLNAIAEELSAKQTDCLTVQVDITDEVDCRQAVAQIRDRFHGIDVLINNAGLTQRSAFTQTTADVYRRVMAVNFFGAVYCTQSVAADLMQRQGMIIVMSSVAGFAPLYGRSGYAASKHALHGFFGTLRTELRPANVDVMLVCPSFVATDFRFRALDGDGSITRHPQSTVGRIITADTAADAIFSAACLRRRMLVLSPAGKAAWWISRLMPAAYEYLMTRSLQSELQR
jgi:NAD(P)-dependent dehydrogenase (short-subunit alcohol dehydrogenase family)